MKRILTIILVLILLLVGWTVREQPSLDGVESDLDFHYKWSALEIETNISSRDVGFVRSRELPRYVSGAFIVAEDGNFYLHNGIDSVEIWYSIRDNVRTRRLKRGGSTITQQLVKNCWYCSEKTFRRKFQEIITALRLEKRLSKPQILDYYLNSLVLGRGIIGIGPAAREYFHKRPEQLLPKEAALLAAMVRLPPVGNDSNLGGYRYMADIILKRLKDQDYLPGGQTSLAPSR